MSRDAKGSAIITCYNS